MRLVRIEQRQQWSEAWPDSVRVTVCKPPSGGGPKGIGEGILWAFRSGREEGNTRQRAYCACGMARVFAPDPSQFKV